MERPHSKTAHLNRGQITVIIIMAILMITIFMAMNYIITNKTTAQTEQGQQRQQLTQASIAPIKEYVTDCLNVATQEALETMGMQGGYLFTSQGGSVPDFSDDEFGETYVTYESGRVAYAITKPNKGYNIAGFFYADVPNYPYITYPELHTDTVSQYYEGYFGENHLVQIEPPGTYNAKEQLETFISNKLKTCLLWGTFESQGLNVTASTPHVNVTLSREDTIADLDYALNITEKRTGVSSEMRTFRSSVPVRLRYLIEFMNLLSDKESSQGNFTLSQAQQRGISTTILQDIEGKDYLVRLLDDQSKILDIPYLFQFMVHNRPPALHIINDSAHEDEVAGYFVCSSRTPEGDSPATIFITENNKLRIQNGAGCDQDLLELQLNSTEPDEHNITYQFNALAETTQSKGPFSLSPDQALNLERMRERRVDTDATMEGWLLVNVSASDGSLADFQQLHFRTTYKQIT